jgi:hypothetical protein
MKSAPFIDGVIPSGRPAIKDYAPIVRRLLLDTAHSYEAWILSNDGFPDKELQYAWAREAWELACKDAGEEFKLSERMMTLVRSRLLINFCICWLFQITARGSRIRGNLKDIIRPLAPGAFGFTPSSSKSATLANVKRYLYLMEDRKFHYKVSSSHEESCCKPDIL